MGRKQVLSRLVFQEGWRSGVELGVYKAETLFHLLDDHHRLKMVGVDSWNGNVAPAIQDRMTGRTSYAHKPMGDIREAVIRQAAHYGDRCSIIIGDTAKAAVAFVDETFDFVFLDACHETEAVLADIAAWRPKIKAHGRLTGHDSNWPSVRRALDIAVPGWTQLESNVWIGLP